jgi:cell division septum initiation protein DivIVA
VSAKSTKLARLAGETTALRDRVAELEQQIAAGAHAKALAAIAAMVGADLDDPAGVAFHVRERLHEVQAIERRLEEREGRLARVRRAAAGDGHEGEASRG